MPKIKLVAIQCATPDEIDKDELYLKMEGKRIWPESGIYHRVDTGDKVALDIEFEVKNGWHEIEVWDFDFVSRNDLLGVFKFSVDAEPGSYSTTMTLLEKGSTAMYHLFWKIL